MGGAEVPGPWAVSLDLQDAYYHVAVDTRYTKYLRFTYDGEIFEFQVLPFGLSTTPRTFTPLVRAVGAYLKTLGINVFQYLDDWLVVGETYQLALTYRDTVRWVTQEGRLHPERGEIRLGSVPVSSVSGVFSRLGPPPGVSVGGLDRSVAAAYPSMSEVSGKSGETLEVVVRSPGQYDSTGTRGPAAHSSPPVLCASEVGHVHAGVDPSVSHSGCPGDPSIVAPYSEPRVRGSFLGPGSGDDDRHRRFVLRVGRSPGRPNSFWHLATPVEVETYQLARTSGGLAHAAAFPATAEGHSGGGAVGQHDDSVLHQQARRNSLSVAVQTSPGLVGVVRRAPDHHIGDVSCRREQCLSGCAVEGQLLPDGVDPPQVDF